jgi:hypothetical protein
MKYAMPFFAFQLFLVALYVFFISFSNSEATIKVTSEPLSADNFNFAVNLDSGDVISFRGTKFQKTQDNFKFSNPNGYYKTSTETQKVFFSGNEGGISNDRSFFLKGNVEINRGDLIFKGEELFYNSATKIYSSGTPTTLLTKDARFDGVDFRYNTTEGKLSLKNTKGRIEF